VSAAKTRLLFKDEDQLADGMPVGPVTVLEPDEDPMDMGWRRKSEAIAMAEEFGYEFEEV
jgi:hypothetical protein